MKPAAYLKQCSPRSVFSVGSIMLVAAVNTESAKLWNAAVLAAVVSAEYLPAKKPTKLRVNVENAKKANNVMWVCDGCQGSHNKVVWPCKKANQAMWDLHLQTQSYMMSSMTSMTPPPHRICHD